MLTLVLGIGHYLRNHCLDDTYIAIERAAQGSAKQCHPEVEREAYNKQGCYGTKASHDQHWFPTNAVTQPAPIPVSPESVVCLLFRRIPLTFPRAPRQARRPI